MRSLIVALLLTPILTISCTSAQERQSSVKPGTEQTQTGSKEIDFDHAVFVDVRTPGEFEQGSFEGAINIPLDELNGRISELNQDDQIVVLCRSGSRASRAMDLLKSKGYESVINGINTANLNSLKEK